MKKKLLFICFFSMQGLFGADFFEVFPDEIIQEIFEYVLFDNEDLQSATKELCRIGLVNKSWKNQALDILLLSRTLEKFVPIQNLKMLRRSHISQLQEFYKLIFNFNKNESSDLNYFINSIKFVVHKNKSERLKVITDLKNSYKK